MKIQLKKLCSKSFIHLLCTLFLFIGTSAITKSCVLSAYEPTIPEDLID